MAGTGALGSQISGNWSLISSCMRMRPNNSFVRRTGYRINMHPVTTSSGRASLPRASSDPQRERTEDKKAFVSQEELKYLIQVGGVATAGAAAIKYGSIIFPEITRPNLGQALIMIFAPVLVAIFFLIKQSRLDSDT
ncbi:hypothetical protein ACS0TY_003178 [Phlomoides rotata]